MWAWSYMYWLYPIWLPQITFSMWVSIGLEAIAGAGCFCQGSVRLQFLPGFSYLVTSHLSLSSIQGANMIVFNLGSPIPANDAALAPSLRQVWGSQMCCKVLYVWTTWKPAGLKQWCAMAFWSLHRPTQVTMKGNAGGVRGQQEGIPGLRRKCFSAGEVEQGELGPGRGQGWWWPSQPSLLGLEIVHGFLQIRPLGL